ncbi:MAG: alpha/beta fold hydrolase [Oscillatoriales cyanobacterium SM2_1_8]|nr:alpha/beta fold hydrolase [Oscillatoriales cyanobacterium SM2_1_8]
MVDIRKNVWQWGDRTVAYWEAGPSAPGATDLPAAVLIHGFGASAGHWRKTFPALAPQVRTYALDLLGFGASDKPKPGPDFAYTFETWGAQINAFCQEVVGTPVTLVGNSIGAIAAMQAAVMAPAQTQRVILLNCSLRLLHERKQAGLPWYRRVGSRWVQRLLQNRAIARLFFAQVANPQAVRNVLKQAYARHEAIDSELIAMLLAPARHPHAVDVFVAFTGYSGGPTPEDLLAQLPCPAVVLWGDRDPWEPIALGAKFQEFACVQAFVPLPGVGHCPQDEAPELVNPLLLQFLR